MTSTGISITSYELKQGAVGFAGSLFQSLSGMGLLLDVGAVLIPVFAIAGEYAPLSVLLGFLFSILLINTTYLFSRKYSSSGGYIHFISTVFGRRAGKTIGWLYCLYTFAVLPNIAIFLGMLYIPPLLGQFLPGFHITMAGSLGIMALVILTVTVLVMLGIKPTMRFVIVAGITEMALLVSLSIAVWHQTGYTISSKPFWPAGGSAGAIGGGALFALLLFAGSGSPVMLGEEVTSPLKNISNSIIASVTAVGVLLVFAAYVFTIKLGSGTYSVSGSYLPSIAVGAGPLFGTFVSIFVVISAISLAVSYMTGLARGVFFMARNGLMMHPQLGRLGESRRVPYAAVLIAGFLSFATAALSTFLLGPYNAFLLLITTVTAGFVLIHLVANAALMRDMTLKKIGLLRRFVLPALSCATLVSVLALTIIPGNWIILAPVVIIGVLSMSVLAIASLQNKNALPG